MSKYYDEIEQSLLDVWKGLKKSDILKAIKEHNATCPVSGEIIKGKITDSKLELAMMENHCAVLNEEVRLASECNKCSIMRCPMSCKYAAKFWTGIALLSAILIYCIIS